LLYRLQFKVAYMSINNLLFRPFLRGIVSITLTEMD